VDRAVDALKLLRHVEPVIGHGLGPFEPDMAGQAQVEHLHALGDGGLADAEEFRGVALAPPLLGQQAEQRLIVDPPPARPVHGVNPALT